MKITLLSISAVLGALLVTPFAAEETSPGNGVGVLDPPATRELEDAEEKCNRCPYRRGDYDPCHGVAYGKFLPGCRGSLSYVSCHGYGTCKEGFCPPDSYLDHYLGKCICQGKQHTYHPDCECPPHHYFDVHYKECLPSGKPPKPPKTTTVPPVTTTMMTTTTPAPTCNECVEGYAFASDASARTCFRDIMNEDNNPPIGGGPFFAPPTSRNGVREGPFTFADTLVNNYRILSNIQPDCSDETMTELIGQIVVTEAGNAVTVTVMAFPDGECAYVFENISVYVSQQPLPVDMNGAPTVNPAQYPDVVSFPTNMGVPTSTFTIGGFTDNDPVYIIVYVEACPGDRDGR